MSLLNFLKNNEDIRKLFGKRELIIIEKQLNGINLTQSEKNRLSRDIRRKLGVVKSLADYKEEFGLKKGTKVKEEIEEAKEIIMNDELGSKIKKIILFGSSADNTRTFRSDVDIAVIFKEINEKEALKFRLRVLKNLREDMDIQVYNVLPDKIKKEIDEKGKVLYESN